MIHVLTAGVDQPAGVLGGKAHELVAMIRLGLPVPAGFVLDTRGHAAFRSAGTLPAGLTDAVRDLGAPAVSVRSGAPVSMPGMMDTVLDVPAADVPAAVRAVLASWDTPRAVTYRALHDIPDDLGTAVVVQAMVFGDRDARSGSGVAFSRDPGTGAPMPFGEFLPQARGDAVVSGAALTRPLTDLPAEVREPLVTGLSRLERHYRDACHVEFTVESGRLWFLQARAGGMAGRAAVRAAVDQADEGLIDPRQALRRVTPHDLAAARTPRIRSGDVVCRGLGACPGVATGQVAVTADRAVRMAARGPVILVRPHTSPLDMHGLAAARGIVTARGGPASHAAVVARALGRPAVVGARDVTVDEAAGCVRVGDRVLTEGTVVTIDGAGGKVVLGSAEVVEDEADPALDRLLAWADEVSGGVPGGSEEERLRAAHRLLPE